MKNIFLFSTRLRVFLIELPPILLLIPSIIYNGSVKTLMKLYPLIIMLSALIVFIAIYFFRAIIINNEELRTIGLFSTREKAIIKENRSLVVTKLSRRRIRIELFGQNDDGQGTYEWLKNEEPVEINLFRVKANGTSKTVAKILRYFEADSETVNALLLNDNFLFDTEKVSFTSSIVKEAKTVKILFKETI